MAVTKACRKSQAARPDRTLIALKSAALLLPGLVSPSLQAQDEASDGVSIQYSRYSEGDRDLISVTSNQDPLHIEVFHAATSLRLNDRLRFSLDYTQDTWSGATPVMTAPLASNPNREILTNTPNGVISVGASPYANTSVLLNAQRTPLSGNAATGLITDPREVLVMATASPESRDQLELGLSYSWDNNSALDVGSGFSVEKDYESFYLSAAGSLQFNQQNTTLSFGGSYTWNEISAILDPDFTPYLTTLTFDDRISRIEDSDVLFDDNNETTFNLGLTQIVSQSSLLDLGVGFSHMDGYLENPYKAMAVAFVDPANIRPDPTLPATADIRALMEQRPDQRDQAALTARFVQYIAAFDAALHFTWEQSTDNWGIDSQALALEWVQPLPNDWMITPRLRYYSQDSAKFYHSYLVSEQAFRKLERDSLGRAIWFDANDPAMVFFQDPGGEFVAADGSPADVSSIDLLPRFRDFDNALLPENFSSDHRLSGFGSLSGGVTISKRWRNGLSMEAGIEYYDRRSSLARGSKGNSDFADFDFWTANAAITIGLDRPRSQMSSHEGMHTGGMDMGDMEHGMHQLPAGIMFGRMMNTPGSFMTGYHYSFSRRSNELLQGSDAVDDLTIVANGCPGTSGCRLIPTYMNMKMHMLNFMYAPTSWLNLMVMPQFMDMDMNLRDLEGRPPPVFETHEHSGIGGHTTGGISDAVVAGLFRIHDDPVHHLHAGFGVSIPLGSVDEELRRTFRNDGGLIHFGMQLGSGTWDALPSLTYTGNRDAWQWGAQLSGIKRLGDVNDSGYQLGDVARITAWGGYSLSPSIGLTLRYLLSDIDTIEGDFLLYNARTGPMDFPQSQGGRFQDIGAGLSYHFTGRFAGNMLSLEWMQPVRDDVNGFQRKRDGSLAAIWHFSF